MPFGSAHPSTLQADPGRHARYLKLQPPQTPKSLLFSDPADTSSSTDSALSLSPNNSPALLSNLPPPRKSSLTPVIRLFFFVFGEVETKTRKTHPKTSILHPDPLPPTATPDELISIKALDLDHRLRPQATHPLATRTRTPNLDPVHHPSAASTYPTHCTSSSH